jgi:diguanylate cyclase (GGDEF)-like protein
MPDKADRKKTAIQSIRRNVQILNAIVLLIVFSLLFLNIRFLFEILNYIPSLSMIAMLTFVAGLVLLSLYLSRIISKNAIKGLEKYEHEVKSLITSMENEIAIHKQTEEELRALSLTDELTGLNNRRGFLTLADQFLKLINRDKIEAFMLYADLDNLKGINDTHGHREGDKVLKEIANILKENYRESDIMARIGGDEFVVLPVGFTRFDAEILNKRLHDKVKILNTNRNRGYKISMSTGIAYYDPNYPCSINKLLAEADKMMYEQKRQKTSDQRI